MRCNGWMHVTSRRGPVSRFVPREDPFQREENMPVEDVLIEKPSSIYRSDQRSTLLVAFLPTGCRK